MTNIEDYNIILDVGYFSCVFMMITLSLDFCFFIVCFTVNSERVSVVYFMLENSLST